ncbi:MAG TPA: L,D-transpeptidase [Ignavibacteriaceae bacterium]|nr:L,D-transpeptidase [Ignavibacteriaceae bacterium]
MKLEQIKKILTAVRPFFNKTVARNIIFSISGIILFLAGTVVYGIVLNLRDVPISEAMLKKGFTRLEEVNILIDRKNYMLHVYEDTVLIKSYRASFGRNLRDKKKMQNDGATPVGSYNICSIDSSHNYYKYLRLNYPNLDDGAEALKRGNITQREFNDIKFDFYYNDCIQTETVLGNMVGIHGIGRLNYIFKNLPFVYNWTNGSIAVSNENIDELLTVIGKGTTVVIK